MCHTKIQGIRLLCWNRGMSAKTGWYLSTFYPNPQLKIMTPLPTPKEKKINTHTLTSPSWNSDHVTLRIWLERYPSRLWTKCCISCLKAKQRKSQVRSDGNRTQGLWNVEDYEERSQRQKAKSRPWLNRSDEKLTLEARASQSFFTVEIWPLSTRLIPNFDWFVSSTVSFSVCFGYTLNEKRRASCEKNFPYTDMTMCDRKIIFEHFGSKGTKKTKTTENKSKIKKLK